MKFAAEPAYRRRRVRKRSSSPRRKVVDRCGEPYCGAAERVTVTIDHKRGHPRQVDRVSDSTPDRQQCRAGQTMSQQHRSTRLQGASADEADDCDTWCGRPSGSQTDDRCPIATTVAREAQQRALSDGTVPSRTMCRGLESRMRPCHRRFSGHCASQRWARGHSAKQYPMPQKRAFGRRIATRSGRCGPEGCHHGGVMQEREMVAGIPCYAAAPKWLPAANRVDLASVSTVETMRGDSRLGPGRQRQPRG